MCDTYPSEETVCVFSDESHVDVATPHTVGAEKRAHQEAALMGRAYQAPLDNVETEDEDEVL